MKFLLIPFMAFVSRMHGGGWPSIPYSLDAWILAAPYLLLYPMIGWWVVPAYFGAVLSIRTGHGSFFHYTRSHYPDRTPERIEIIMPKSLPVWAYKALGMALTGFGVTLIPAIALASYGYYIEALVIALSGLLKAVAYILPNTEHSEYARGIFLGLGLAIVL